MDADYMAAWHAQFAPKPTVAPEPVAAPVEPQPEPEAAAAAEAEPEGGFKALSQKADAA